MIKDKKINRLLPLIEKRIRSLFGENVLKIILFGSYARGDFDSESDVDIIVLVKNRDLYLYRKNRIKLILEYLDKYNIYLSIRIVEADKFIEYKEVLPFYQNVAEQGIVLYG